MCIIRKDFRYKLIKKLYNTGYNCKYDLDFGIKELVKVVDLIDEPVNANY